MNPIELIRWENGRHSSKLYSLNWEPNYIADVVLSYFPKFSLYIYSICSALSQTIPLITDPSLMAEGRVQIRLLSTSWCNCGKWRRQLWMRFHPPALFWLGKQKPRRWCGWCLGWDVSLNVSNVPSYWKQMSKHLWLTCASSHIFQPYCSINPAYERKGDVWLFHAVWLVIKMAWKCVGHKVKENRRGITWTEFNFIIKCWKKKKRCSFPRV